MSGFFDLVKSGKLKSPTQRGFCLSKWNRSWSELSANATFRDNKIYNAGIVFHSLLDEIRVDLEKMYNEKLPKVNNDQLIVAYMALSNRERFKLSEKIESMNENLQSSRISNNIMNNEITFFEGSEGAVDAFEKALFFCKKSSEDAVVLKQGTEPLDLESFILKVSYLSQNYGAYEKYWQSILWCDFDFMEVDVDNKVFLIKQPQSDLEIGKMVSQNRKNKLQANSAFMGTTPLVQRIFETDTYVSFVKEGRKKRLVCRPIKNSDEWLRSTNAGFSADIIFLDRYFGVDFTDFNLKKGFSIKEALEVLKRLTLLSEVFSRSYPKGNSTLTLDFLSGFCPKVDKTELCIALSKSTEFSFSKVKKILEFFEYNTYERKDLWCHPIVSVFGSKYALLTSALVTPVILRIVEHWLVELEVDLKNKGTDYEKMIIKDLNDVISKNKKITDFDEATSRRLRIKENEDEEEIDLMLRIGNVILIGEAKSIVTTDSPISNYRCLEILRYASTQVKRKTDFFKRNLPEIFKRLGWKYDANKEYFFVGCILNSGRMYVGSTIDSVPVCDEIFLKKYFSSDKIPLFSVYCEEIKDHRHLSWFKIYDNFEEMQNSLGRYLESPPQVCISPAFFEYKEAVVPFLSESSYKIVFSRMVYKNLSLSDISELSSIGREFPIEKIDSYQEEVDKIDYIF